MASWLKKQDLCWCLISSLITLVGLYKLPPAQATTPLVILSCLVGPAASAAVAVLALRRPQLYLASRTSLLAMIKVLRFSTVGALARAYAHAAQPGSAPAEGVAAPATKGLMLLVAGLGWQLPVATTLAVQGAGLALYLASTPERCAFECSSPAAQGFYERVAGGVTAALVSPVGVARRADPRLGRGVPACLLVQCWVQAVLGWVLPTLLADYQAATAPARWFPGAKRMQRGLATASGYLLLFVLASVLCWKALEVWVAWRVMFR